MTAMPAARVTDPFGHSSAMTGVLTGLAIGALVGVAIIATGGLGAIAIGAAIATTGAAGLAGQAIGQTIDGPITGVLQNGSLNVRINRLAATMVMIGTGTCSQDSGLRKVASGSSTVKINGQLAARVSETMDCSAVIRKGSPDVNIGGPTEQVLAIEPEVPAWLTTTMTVAAIGGTILATGGIAATYGAGAAIGSLVGGLGGGYLGGKGGEMAAAALGYGATGQAIGGVVGGLAGGALGGAAGFRGGGALTPRTPPLASAAARAVPSAREKGVAHEAARLAQLGIPKNNSVWRPGQADFDSAAFKVIVGEPKFTPGGIPKGTIFDGTRGGNLELKGGSSMLDSSYQLRLQTFRSLKTNTPLTIETTRPINPAFQSWLDRWGVSVTRPE